ncbi:hypothetical protein M409DRAFT_17837 [Zasmidium cellare ATCC 36951]|uniref:ACB domain-containing protein n=1 Tax=Zasmidium cellare ATCC 36951 TaxID=1080233 RepID=A0A6A6CZH2_ZASCE|nr:uncharacterized protein M409DRAFT_17837 [Zasmidium cellare ATCC 36951]KAF2171600.1 hypothetical protein M409DRAFT_17837 [Zasmidium cellare ATCC 36951]
MADDETPVVLSPEFEKAAKEVKTLAEEPDQKQQLKLYALYKIGRKEKASSSMANIFRRSMYNAYKAETEVTKTAEEAQRKYVELVEQLKKEIGTK